MAAGVASESSARATIVGAKVPVPLQDVHQPLIPPSSVRWRGGCGNRLLPDSKVETHAHDTSSQSGMEKVKTGDVKKSVQESNAASLLPFFQKFKVVAYLMAS